MCCISSTVITDKFFEREKSRVVFSNAVEIADESYFLFGDGKKIAFVSYF